MAPSQVWLCRTNALQVRSWERIVSKRKGLGNMTYRAPDLTPQRFTGGSIFPCASCQKRRSHCKFVRLPPHSSGTYLTSRVSG